MLHYAINKLAGMQWGEPDIAPLLPWLARYASWMEDRVRLNRFRQAYLYIVTGKFISQGGPHRRQNELNANPPKPRQHPRHRRERDLGRDQSQARQLRGQQ